MEMGNIVFDIIDGVAVVKIDRRETLNSLNSQVIEDLGGCLYMIEHNPEVKVVIITGAGENAFVAGADIKEMAEMNSFEAHEFARKGQGLMIFIEKMKKTVIAAVNGYALGGGLELALACDFMYASEKAKIGFPEVTLGIMPGFGGTQNLARLIGPNRAKELIFSGRILTSREAKEWGIINAVFPGDELHAKVMGTAREIAMNGILGVTYAKDAISNGLNMTKDDGFRYESSLFGVLFATEDQKEGMKSFLSKKKAKFEGR